MQKAQSIMVTTCLQVLALLIMAIAFTGNVNAEEEFNEEQYRRELEGSTNADLLNTAIGNLKMYYSSRRSFKGLVRQYERLEEEQSRQLDEIKKSIGHMRVYRFQLEDAQAELTKLGYEGPLLLKDPYEYHEHKKQAAEENADSQADESEGKAEAVSGAEAAE